MSFLNKLVSSWPDEKVLIETENESFNYSSLRALANKLEVSNDDIIIVPKYQNLSFSYCLQAACIIANKAFICCEKEQPLEDEFSLQVFGEITPLLSFGNEMIWKGKLQESIRAHIRLSGLVALARTSGSTENSKIVPSYHNNYATFYRSAIEVLNLGEEAKLADFAHFPSDMTLTNLLLCMLSGAVWHPLLGLREKMFPLLACKQFSLTHIRMVATSVPIFQADFQRNKQIPDSLSYVCFGGEVLDWKKVQICRQILPQSHVINSYGATEVAGFCSAYVIENECDIKNHSGHVSIGKAFLGFEYEQSSKEELIISSESLPPGYFVLKGSDFQYHVLTQKDNGYRIFESKDVCRMDSGEATILYRSGNLVKIKGRFFDTVSLESYLLEKVGVESIVVIKDSQLRCFIRQPRRSTTKAVNHYLSQYCLHYDIGFEVVHVKHFPLTLSGKKDRNKALRFLEKR